MCEAPSSPGTFLPVNKHRSDPLDEQIIPNHSLDALPRDYSGTIALWNVDLFFILVVPEWVDLFFILDRITAVPLCPKSA